MDKIAGSMGAAHSLQITEKAPHYDAASKEILSNREFLAIILKYTVREYADMSYREIADCIEGDSIRRTEGVAPGRGDSDRIGGMNAEFNVLGEMMSHFDVLFKAVNPKTSGNGVTCYLHIDIESQNDYQPGYPLEKRGIFYMARMLGSQIPAPAVETNYGALEKVYSIWICRNRIPKGMQNTMSVYGMANLWNSRDMATGDGDYDLMAMVLLRLGNPDGECREDIIRILNALFYPRDEKSYEILSEYVDFSESLKREVRKMSGLGETVFWEGVERGIEQGIVQGIEQGIEQGIGRGIEKGMEMLILNMYRDGMPIGEIARYARMPVEKVEGIIGSQEVPV